MISISADIDQSSSVSKALVDTNNLTTITGSGTLDIHVALALAGAVSAGPVHFAVVFGVEVDDL